MAAEDWRIHVELEGEEERGDFLARLRGGLGDEAEELARALTGEHLIVSRDGEEIFVYASSEAGARRAHELIEAELKRHGFEAKVGRIEHWLEDEQRWDSEPKGETWEEEALERGWAPWEVRLECTSRDEAKALVERLEGEGFRPVRRWSYVVIGTDSRDEAEKLAGRLHGEVELGGEIVWEEAADARIISPFRIFG